MRRRVRLVRCALLAVALVALVVGNHYAPLQPAVVVVYLGLLAMVAGLVSLARPLRFLGIATRVRGALVLFGGAALLVAGTAWPPATTPASGPYQRLDHFMPASEFREFHEARARATAERVRQAVGAVRFSDIPVAAFLMRLRGMAAGHFEAPRPDPRPILALFSQPGSGFLPLDQDWPGEVVYGMVGRPWTEARPPDVRTPDEFRAFRAPGHIKVAFNIRWMDAGGGYTRITTETRCTGTDDGARRVFARYWRLIYPGSATIRRVWLDAIVATAERSGGT